MGNEVPIADGNSWPRRGLSQRRKLPERIPLPECRMIRHNSPMTPLLSGDCEEATGLEGIIPSNLVRPTLYA